MPVHRVLSIVIAVLKAIDPAQAAPSPCYGVAARSQCMVGAVQCKCCCWHSHLSACLKQAACQGTLQHPLRSALQYIVRCVFDDFLLYCDCWTSPSWSNRVMRLINAKCLDSILKDITIIV